MNDILLFGETESMLDSEPTAYQIVRISRGRHGRPQYLRIRRKPGRRTSLARTHRRRRVAGIPSDSNWTRAVPPAGRRSRASEPRRPPRRVTPTTAIIERRCSDRSHRRLDRGVSINRPSTVGRMQVRRHACLAPPRPDPPGRPGDILPSTISAARRSVRQTTSDLRLRRSPRSAVEPRSTVVRSSSLTSFPAGSKSSSGVKVRTRKTG